MEAAGERSEERRERGKSKVRRWRCEESEKRKEEKELIVREQEEETEKRGKRKIFLSNLV